MKFELKTFFCILLKRNKEAQGIKVMRIVSKNG